MASLPPPPPIDGVPNSSTSTTLLTNKERKALADVKLKEINLNRIKVANTNLNSFDPNRTMFTFHLGIVPVTSSNETLSGHTLKLQLILVWEWIVQWDVAISLSFIPSIDSKRVADVKTYSAAYEGGRTALCFDSRKFESRYDHGNEHAKSCASHRRKGRGSSCYMWQKTEILKQHVMSTMPSHSTEEQVMWEQCRREHLRKQPTVSIYGYDIAQIAQQQFDWLWQVGIYNTKLGSITFRKGSILLRMAYR